MKRIILGILTILLMLSFSGCGDDTSNSQVAKIGFKSFYLNDNNKKQVCDKLKQYSIKYNANYQEKKYKNGKSMCRVDANMNQDWFIISFDKQKEIYDLDISGYWTDILFDSSGMNQKTLAQSLVNNIPWLTNLQVRRKNVGYTQVNYYIQNGKSWKFELSPSKIIKLKKIYSKNYN